MKAIVYTSNTGYTKQYAELLSQKTGLPAYTLREARKALQKGDKIIYLGWLFASHVRDYGKTAKLYDIAAVCGVGLCTTGALLREARAATAIPENIPLFTLQGGLDMGRLRGMNKFIITMMINGLDVKPARTDSEEAMLALLKKGGSYVSADNLHDILEWYENAE